MFNEAIARLNNNKVLIGLAMIGMNIGSRFLIADFTHVQERLMATTIFKKLVLFFIFFVATRDVLFAVAMTAAFTLVTSWLLNHKSIFNMIPKTFLQMPTPLPQISKNEYDRAKAIVDTFESIQTSQKNNQIPTSNITKRLLTPTALPSYYQNLVRLKNIVQTI